MRLGGGQLCLIALTACRLHFDATVDGDANGSNASDGDPGDGAVVAGVQRTLSSTGDCASVAWSGDRAGVVWREGTNPGNVQFATVDAMGALVDGPITIGSVLANLDCPAIAWTGGQFLVAMSYGALNQRDIDVTSIVGTSASAFSNIVTDSADSRTPVLAFFGSDAAVAWFSVRGASSDTWFRRTTATGGGSYIPILASGSSSINAAPDIAYNGIGFAAFWVADNSTIHSRVLALTGAQPSEQTLSALGAATGRVGVAYNGSNIHAAWADSTTSTQLVVTQIDAFGNASAGPTKVAAPRASNVHAVWTGSRLGVLYYETYGLVQYHLAQFAADTTFLDDTPVANAGSSGNLAITWATDRYVIAFDSNGGVTVKYVVPP